MLISMIFFVVMVSVVLLMVSLVLSMKNCEDREKSSPYECGFDSFSSSRLPFSLRFFLVAVIFVVFDVEISLIIPIIFSLWYSNSFISLFTGSFFLIILFLGLFHEHREGSLEWVN
uniref:NADH-ubiquinone oxidoreductase chain 3 n=1 Tax=Perumytilus purpuratus TaxID=390823 RepID=A0A346KL02_PERPP|nr:NADH dehydrogenase subunit 3 [Perumytilus purpuratus]